MRFHNRRWRRPLIKATSLHLVSGIASSSLIASSARKWVVFDYSAPTTAVNEIFIRLRVAQSSWLEISRLFGGGWTLNKLEINILNWLFFHLLFWGMIKVKLMDLVSSWLMKSTASSCLGMFWYLGGLISLTHIVGVIIAVGMSLR